MYSFFVQNNNFYILFLRDKKVKKRFFRILIVVVVAETYEGTAETTTPRIVVTVYISKALLSVKDLTKHSLSRRCLLLSL
jgi:hypothetical protein